MFDDEDITIATSFASNEGRGNANAFNVNGVHRQLHSPLSDELNVDPGLPDERNDDGGDNDEEEEPRSTYQPPQNVLTNNKSPTTPHPSRTTWAASAAASRAQQPLLTNQEAAVINETLMGAISSEDMLESFLRKYPRPTPGSGVGVGPIKSTTQGNDSKGRPRPPGYHLRKKQQLREKRRHLRALQDEEFRQATTPPRRANSAAVGLLSFGITFILFGLVHTGHFELDTVVPGACICVGGGAQVLAALLSWTQGQTFAYVSFFAGGCFFLAVASAWMLPNASFTITGKHVQPSSDYFTGVFCSIWGVLFSFLLICTPRMNLCIFAKVLTTVLCFLCLAGGLMANNTMAVHVGGYFGIITGAVSLYLLFASLLNEVWDCAILPVFQTTKLLEGAPLWEKAEQPPATAQRAVEVDEEVTERRSAPKSRSGRNEEEEEEEEEEQEGEEEMFQPAVQPATQADM